MTKKITATILLMLIVTFLLCGCLSQPFAKVTINVNTSNEEAVSSSNKPLVPTRVLYVSGAVQNDGYITIPQICDYKTVLELAGVTDCTVMPNNLSTLISAELDSLIFDFESNGAACVSVDVNGDLVILRQSIDGVDDTIVNKIADYIETGGKITNRNALKNALGDDYADNYYKFYIDIYDYA